VVDRHRPCIFVNERERWAAYRGRIYAQPSGNAFDELRLAGPEVAMQGNDGTWRQGGGQPLAQRTRLGCSGGGGR